MGYPNLRVLAIPLEVLMVACVKKSRLYNSAIEKEEYILVKEVPFISIVTPSLNQGEYIEENIKSVINQNYPHFEHIIIDGGSTDRSVDIIRKYEAWFAH